MTPEQKSTQIFRKFHQELDGDYNWCWEKAKELAAFVVDEIIASNPTEPCGEGYHEIAQDRIDAAIQYWNEVKQHILNQ